MLFTYLDSSKILFEFLHSTLKMFEPVLLRCVGARKAGREMVVENTIAIYVLQKKQQ